MPPKKQANKPLLRTDKVPLPEFLRLLNETGMSMANAMAVAGKVYKTHNTPEKLGALNAAELTKLGIDSQERRTEILDAMKKFKVISTPIIPSTSNAASRAGGSLTSKGKGPASLGNDEDEDEEVKKRKGEENERQERALDVEERRRAALASLQEKFSKRTKESSPSKKRKWSRDDDIYADPTASTPSSTKLGGAALYDFHEILDEELLKNRTVVINRAPVMMAWSCIVAEKIGFEREEALSIASAYTEMNAITKGANIGIYNKGKEEGMEPGRGTAQPHVELMGRRIPLFQTEGGQWRALMKGEPVTPEKAFSYITRALAQMHPYLLGAMALLAQSFEDPQQLNNRGYSLYCDFRPENTGWGVKQEVKLETILRLRNKYKAQEIKEEEKEKKSEDTKKSDEDGRPFDEFEALGDEDFTLMDLYESQD